MTIVSGVQSHPAGYTGGPITIRAWAPPGTTFVQGFSAVLNITYTYVGQIVRPFIIKSTRPGILTLYLSPSDDPLIHCRHEATARLPQSFIRLDGC